MHTLGLCSSEHSCWRIKHFGLLNPFIVIKNKRRVMSSEGFSGLEKNAVICYTVKRLFFPSPACHLPNSPWPGIIPAGDGKSDNFLLQCIRVQCCPSSRLWRPDVNTVVMSVWPLFKKFELALIRSTVYLYSHQEKQIFVYIMIKKKTKIS